MSGCNPTLQNENSNVMKILKIITCIVVVCGMSALTGCKKEDINETGSTTTPNLSTRGGLAFHIVDGSGNNIQGVTINIALSQSDLASGTYLGSRITGSDGRADFGLLNSGNYYYKADVTINNVPFHGEGVVQVQAGENLTQELTLE